jgi:hypothetical protein
MAETKGSVIMFGTTLNPSEVLGFVLCLLILLYVVNNKRTLLGGKYAFITYGFFCIAASFFFTNLEEFFLEDLINIIEHALSAAGAVYVAVGCRRLLLSKTGEKGEAL